LSYHPAWPVEKPDAGRQQRRMACETASARSWGRAGTGSREAAPRVLVRAANGLPRREPLEAEGMEGARGERLARDDRRQRSAHGRAELEALAVAARQHVQALDAGQRSGDGMPVWRA